MAGENINNEGLGQEEITECYICSDELGSCFKSGTGRRMVPNKGTICINEVPISGCDIRKAKLSEQGTPVVVNRLLKGVDLEPKQDKVVRWRTGGQSSGV